MRLTMAQEYIRRRVQAAYGWQVAVPVHRDGIGMDGEAAGRLRGAAEQVARMAGVPAELVVNRLFRYAYRLEPTGTLVLVVGVPERGVEMFVEMGPQSWQPVRPDTSAGEGAADRESRGDGASSTQDGASGSSGEDGADDGETMHPVRWPGELFGG